MFHIKTDIRQYKCESEQKVERLIRNWVIRPTDLIYDAQKDSWDSIGEHAAFQAVFVTIEKEEANEPDTVVTQAPSEIAAEFEVRPGSEHDLSDSDSTLTFEALATDADAQPEYPRPPEAPEGVEGLIRDSDEITMMTDRTLDMFRERDDAPQDDELLADSDAPQAEVVPPPAAPVGRHDLPEDVFVTDEIFRAEVYASVRDDLRDLDDDIHHQGPADGEDDEVTQMVERESVFNNDDAAPKVRDENEAAAEDASAPNTALPGAAPDETLEQPAPAEISADAAAGDDAPATLESAADKARWRIVLSDSQDGQDAPEEPTDATPAGASPVDVEAFDNYQAMDDAELDAMLNEAAALVGLGDDEADAASPKEIEARQLKLLAVDEFGEDDFDKDADAAGWASTKTPVRAKLEANLDISGGYALPLPVDISPSAEAIKLGLVHSRLSREAKDAVFPRPEPKVPGEMARRVFDLAPPAAEQPPRDQSLRVIVAIVLCIILALFIAVTFFG